MSASARVDPRPVCTPLAARSGGSGAVVHTAFRTPLFSVHISVSLYGKSWPSPTGFHTFYVVRILITRAGSPMHALKSVRPHSIPRGPSHANERQTNVATSLLSSRAYVCNLLSAGSRRARP